MSKNQNHYNVQLQSGSEPFALASVARLDQEYTGSTIKTPHKLVDISILPAGKDVDEEVRFMTAVGFFVLQSERIVQYFSPAA